MKLTGYNEPLGLPRGSVRALVSLVVVLPLPCLVVLACVGQVLSGEVMAFYTALVLLVLRDYFGSRQVQDAASPKEDPATTAVG